MTEPVTDDLTTFLRLQALRPVGQHMSIRDRALLHEIGVRAAANKPLTSRQSWALACIARRYRRQIPAELVPKEKPGLSGRPKPRKHRKGLDLGRGLWGG